jgi:hypothetical protein
VLEAKFNKKWEEVARKKKKGKSTRQGDLFQPEQEAELFFVGGSHCWGQA